MPSYPFQQHPTFAEYINWAEQNNCSVRTGIVGFITIIKITNNQNSLFVTQANIEQKERLSPSIVSKLDRRLDLKSPWNPNLD